MPLTRDFKETIKERAETDPKFRVALLTEAISALLEGDLETGKMVIRDYINATVGFNELGKLTEKNPKSLMRMFGTSGKPTAENLLVVISQLQQHEGISLAVSPKKREKAPTR